MAYRIYCPGCRLLMGVTGDDMGANCSCPECQTKFVVPPPPPRLVGQAPNHERMGIFFDLPAPHRKRKAPEGWLLGLFLAIGLFAVELMTMFHDEPTSSAGMEAPNVDAFMPDAADTSPEANATRAQIQNFKAQWRTHAAAQEKLRKASSGFKWKMPRRIR